jgi:DnaJ-class molecular chaperone
MTNPDDPFAILGINAQSSVEADFTAAKQAYRKLAMEHHPDRGGDETRFKNINAAWEKIDAGYVRPKPDPRQERQYKSTFDDGPKPRQQTAQQFRSETLKTAGKPAPGYEARGTPPPMPKTVKDAVTLELTIKQAFEGCVIPFIHNGHVLQHTVRPGTISFSQKELFLIDAMIGSPYWNKPASIHVTLNIVQQHKNEEPKIGDMEIVLKICALGLFTGGKITAKDAFNEKISISLPPGYNPKNPITVEGKGYGHDNQRGNLIIKIEPIFKTPAELTIAEVKQLRRLNEMIK